MRKLTLPDCPYCGKGLVRAMAKNRPYITLHCPQAFVPGSTNCRYVVTFSMILKSKSKICTAISNVLEDDL